MRYLLKLYKYQIMGIFRILFLRPINAIFTIVFLGVMGYTLYSTMKVPISDFYLHIELVIWIMTVLFLCIFGLFGGNYLSKHAALIKKQEAFYLLRGPFSKKHVLAYNLIFTFLIGIVISVIFTWIVILIGGKGVLTNGNWLVILFVFLMVVLTFGIVSDYLFLQQLARNKKWYTKIFILILVLVYVLSFLYSYITVEGGTFLIVLHSWLFEGTFVYLPIFGWAIGVILYWLQQDIQGFFVFLMLIMGSFGIVLYQYLYFKGDIREKILLNAEAFSQYYQQIKAGESMHKQTKITNKNTMTFKPGAKAIANLYLGVMKRRNTLIPWYGIIIVGVYMGIAYYVKMSFEGAILFSLLALLFGTSDRQFYKDIKNPYIHLLPDTMFKKIVNMYIPQLIRMSILTFIPVTLLAFLYKINIEKYSRMILIFSSIMLILLASKLIAVYLVKETEQILLMDIMQMMSSTILLIPSSVFVYIINTMHIDMFQNSNIIILSIWHLFLGIFVIFWYSKEAQKGKISVS